MKVMETDDHQVSLWCNHLARTFLTSIAGPCPGESCQIAKSFRIVEECFEDSDDCRASGETDAHYGDIFSACESSFGPAWRRGVLENYKMAVVVIRQAKEAEKFEDETETLVSRNGSVADTRSHQLLSLTTTCKRTWSRRDSVSSTGSCYSSASRRSSITGEGL